MKRSSPPFRSGCHRPYLTYKNNPYKSGKRECNQAHGDTSSSLWANFSANLSASPCMLHKATHSQLHEMLAVAVVTARISGGHRQMCKFKDYNARCLPLPYFCRRLRLQRSRRLLHDSSRRRLLRDSIRRRLLRNRNCLHGVCMNKQMHIYERSSPPGKRFWAVVTATDWKKRTFAFLVSTCCCRAFMTRSRSSCAVVEGSASPASVGEGLSWRASVEVEGSASTASVGGAGTESDKAGAAFLSTAFSSFLMKQLPATPGRGVSGSSWKVGPRPVSIRTCIIDVISPADPNIIAC